MMKNYFLLIIGLLVTLISACSSDSSGSNNTGNLANDYSNYNFYVSEVGCIASGFTKNFALLPEINMATKFDVFDNDILTFGARRYRTGGYTFNQDFSAFVAINGVDVNTDFGGESSSVMGLQKINDDIYYNTGFESQDGVVSSYSVVSIPTVWKNGQELYTLSGPFINGASLYVGSNQTIYDNRFGIQTSGLWIKDNDIYIAGICDDFSSEQVSFGYWKNENYTELYRGTDLFFSRFKFKMSDNGDLYYYCNNSGDTFLFKNDTNILDSTFFTGVDIKDFAVLGSDVYFIGVIYENGNYQFKIYKNGVEQFSMLGYYSDSVAKIYIEDNRIFIASGISDGGDVCVYEYKQDSQSLIKINCTGIDQQSCPFVNLLGFKVVKK